MKNLLNQLNFWYADIDLRNIQDSIFDLPHPFNGKSEQQFYCSKTTESANM